MRKRMRNVGIPNAESLTGERAKLKVFESKEIGQIVIKNRLVRSATTEGMASEDGSVTDELVGLYKTLAEGGVGLIITGYAYVQLSGKSAPYMTGIDRDDLIPGLRKIAETVHEHGDGCKIARARIFGILRFYFHFSWKPP